MKINKIVVLLLITGLAGCSSLKKQMFYSAAFSGIVGGVAGSMLSPNKESRKMNAVVWGAAGAAGGAVLGKVFWEDAPENKPLKPMLDEPKASLPLPKIELSQLSPIVSGDIKASPVKQYDVPTEPLPDGLKEYVKKQTLIEHRTEKKVIKQDGKTYVFPEGQKFYELFIEN